MDWLGEGCHDFGSLSGCEARSDLTFVLPWLLFTLAAQRANFMGSMGPLELMVDI